MSIVFPRVTNKEKNTQKRTEKKLYTRKKLVTKLCLCHFKTEINHNRISLQTEIKWKRVDLNKINKNKEKYLNVTSQEDSQIYLMPSYIHIFCETSQNRGKEWSTEDWMRPG